MQENHQRLSNISTAWTVLRTAHEGTADSATEARRLIVERYGGAIHRYLLRAVGDPHAADDLLQEFVLRLVRGEFRGADPQRGRFRVYVKAVLFHLLSKHRKREARNPAALSPSCPEPIVTPAADLDRVFQEKWRDDLLGRAWAALAQVNPIFHAVLRCRAEQPELSSRALAERLSADLGKPLTADSVRQTLCRARDRFAALLLEEVAASLETPSDEHLREELAELGLLTYCQAALPAPGAGP